jgi:hypothetical protein
MVKSHGPDREAELAQTAKSVIFRGLLALLASENLRPLLFAAQSSAFSSSTSLFHSSGSAIASSASGLSTLLFCPSLLRAAVDAPALTLDISTQIGERVEIHCQYKTETYTHHDLPVGGLFQCLAR